jgi:hypothetical protein
MFESGSEALVAAVHASGRSRRGRARIAIAMVVAATFLTSAAIVIRTSWSSYTAQTVNPGNSWSTGTVTLTDNDSSDAIPMFNVSGMNPGDSRTGCIVVTYGGTMNSSGVHVYVASGDLADTKAAGRTNPLSSYLKLEIYEGDVAGGFSGNVTTNTGGNDIPACAAWAGTNVTGIYNNGGGDSTQTLGAFASTKTNFGANVGTWTPSGGSFAKKAYKFVLTLLNNNDAQGSSSAVKFTFEADS